MAKINHTDPPKWPLRFLRLFVKRAYLEEIEGDMQEVFEDNIKVYSKSKARRLYTWETLKLLRPTIIKRTKVNFRPNQYGMFKHTILLFFRSIKKEVLFAVIKIGGFGVGIAACLLIALFIRDELKYDKHYLLGDRVYRVALKAEVDGVGERGVSLHPPFARTVKQIFPEIEKSGRFLTSENHGAGRKNLRLSGDIPSFNEDGFVYADQELLEILEIPLIQGNSKNALSQPGTIVISKKKADTYFPNGDALGKALILDNDTAKPYKITGIMEDPLANSHFMYDFLMTMKGRDFYPGEDNDWRSTMYFTYILVAKGTNIQSLEKKMYSIIKDYVLPTYNENGWQRLYDIMTKAKFDLQPIGDIHLRSAEIDDGIQHGDIRFVWLFGIITGFILVLACINFVNLSTAKSANRAKEVGLRKTVGAFKGSLIFQFLTESVLYSLVSFIVGTLLAWSLLPYFGTMASKSLEMPWNLWWFVPLIVVSAILVGLLAGLYPAFYLSSFRPIDVLKGTLSIGGKSNRLRSSLVVFQFTTSVVLIIGTLIIYRQMDFILNKELGYDKDQVILIQEADILGNKIHTFKEQLLQLPQVEEVSVSDFLPISGTRRNVNVFWEADKKSETAGVASQIWIVDHDYIKTLGIRITDGRNFSKEMATDSTTAVIVNKTMAHDLGLDNPLGEKIANIHTTWSIIGVMEDFHFSTLREDIYPLAMIIGESPGTISVKLNTGKTDSALKSITGIWNDNVPNQSFEYTFLNQDFEKMHKDVRQMGKIFNSFALFAILVACLGLFALSAFMAEQRNKEISIRIVLGASFKDIYKLLSINFLKLVCVSIVIAIPIGWYIMQYWLEDFAYRISIGPEIILMASLIALTIALLTVSYQSISAAKRKPSVGLRE